MVTKCIRSIIGTANSLQNFSIIQTRCHNLKIPTNIIKNMPLPPPKQRTTCGTYLYFAEPGAMETFIRDYQQILMDNFQKVRIEGGGEYWTCGQDHDPRNWNWKPCCHLERICRKRGLNDFAVRASYFKCRGRNLEFKYQVLNDGIVENEPRFVFSVVLMISFLSILSIGFQSRKSLLIRCASIGFKLKTVLSCHDSFCLLLACFSSLIVRSGSVANLFHRKNK
jgi:hypothetical protein